MASEVAAPDSSQHAIAVNQKVVVYYLYFKPRCETCLNMEVFAKEAVETGFANELKNGTVEWHSYDTDLDENKHFWNDFKLETKALIIEKVQNGKPVSWKNCEKIWELAGAKPDFMKYVQDEIKADLVNP